MVAPRFGSAQHPSGRSFVKDGTPLKFYKKRMMITGMSLYIIIHFLTVMFGLRALSDIRASIEGNEPHLFPSRSCSISTLYRTQGLSRPNLRLGAPPADDTVISGEKHS